MPTNTKTDRIMPVRATRPDPAGDLARELARSLNRRRVDQAELARAIGRAGSYVSRCANEREPQRLRGDYLLGLRVHEDARLRAVASDYLEAMRGYGAGPGEASAPLLLLRLLGREAQEAQEALHELVDGETPGELQRAIAELCDVAVLVEEAMASLQGRLREAG